jgi:hypothetical protein
MSQASVTNRGSGGPGADAASGVTGRKTGIGRWRNFRAAEGSITRSMRGRRSGAVLRNSMPQVTAAANWQGNY